MGELLKILDTNLVLEEYIITDDIIYIFAKSAKPKVECPYCGTGSEKVHSYYLRSFQIFINVSIRGIDKRLN